jgi:outer membrane receptor protein involved in Fe transport
VTENPRDPFRVGQRLAQVPRHRGSIRATFTNPRLADVAVGVQFTGRQFDDDRNERGVPAEGCAPAGGACARPGLPGYALLDLTVSRELGGGVRVFAGAQNVLDEEYFVGTNPTTIGSPRLVHAGVRVRFPWR